MNLVMAADEDRTVSKLGNWIVSSGCDVLNGPRMLLSGIGFSLPSMKGRFAEI